MEPESYHKYDRAKKQVKKIKDFYDHIKIFIVAVVVILIIRFYVVPKLGLNWDDEKDFNNWLNWNTYLFPSIWALVILIHGLIVFKPKVFRKWEDRKMKEFMQKEDKAEQRWD